MMSASSHRGPSVLVVGFHHARGPEIELCISDDGLDHIDQDDCALLPFMALSDGAHLSTEDFSYFTIRQSPTETEPATSVFGISCTRQIDSNLLINRSEEVTRSTVQKAVVVLIREPRHCGLLRERLSVVTTAWFAQRDFSDTEILRRFYDSLIENVSGLNRQPRNESLGLSLREMIREFKHTTLVLFKCLLLQPKMLFFGTRCERLCMIQFSLISLIPGLINHLQDCASPQFDSYAQTAQRPTTLRTSDKNSLLAYMGLPLQIFGKGSIFGPYTPLQKLDMLADYGTKSYVVGSTNSLLLQQKDRYSDILIDLDHSTVNISSPSLRSALALTPADRRWINFLTQTINDTWDDAHPEQPKTHGYLGSEEFIRLQFEEYLLALLSSMKYHLELTGHQKTLGPTAHAVSDIEGDPALEFNRDFLESWQRTSNFALYDKLTADSIPFSIVEPRHPCAGGMGMEDIQRKIASQVSELHLGERVSEGKEALGKHIATGHKRVVSAFNNLWADRESKRTEQRQKQNEKSLSPPPGKESRRISDGNTLSRASSRASVSTQTPSGWTYVNKRTTPELQQGEKFQQQQGSQRATSYIGSWASWASEKRKEWQDRRSSSPSVSPAVISPRTSSVNTLAQNNNNNNNNNNSADSTHSAEQAMNSPPSGEDQPKLTRGRSRRKRFSDMIRRSDSSTRGNAKESSQTRSHYGFSTSPARSMLSSPLSRPVETASVASSQNDSLSPNSQWEDKAAKRNSMPPLSSLQTLAEYQKEQDQRPSTHGHDI